MSAGYDDRDYRDDAEPEPSPGAAIARARAKVAAPGTVLLLAGLVALACEFASIAVMVTAPTLLHDVLVDIIKKQPQTPQQQQQLKDLEAQKDQMRLDSPTNIVSIAVGMVLNVLTVVGALKMRSLSGYGLAMTGAISGIIPCGGCCCLTFPVGIWALIVLLNPDVKAGFQAVSRGAAPGEY